MVNVIPIGALTWLAYGLVFGVALAALLPHLEKIIAALKKTYSALRIVARELRGIWRAYRSLHGKENGDA